MNREFNTLTDVQQAAVRRVVALVINEGVMKSELLPQGGEVYAYPGAQGVHWGKNASDGFCDARGVWPEGPPA